MKHQYDTQRLAYEKVIAQYIQKQLQKDEMAEQLTVDIEDPFTGSQK